MPTDDVVIISHCVATSCTDTHAFSHTEDVFLLFAVDIVVASETASGVSMHDGAQSTLADFLAVGAIALIAPMESMPTVNSHGW